MSTSFKGAYDKLKRAEEHKGDLEKTMKNFQDKPGNRIHLGIKPDQRTKELVLYVSNIPDLSEYLDRCSVLLGDLVQNLMSSLDHLAYQLLLLDSNGKPKRPNQIQFPICDTPEAFSAATKRRMGELSSETIEALEKFQPYYEFHRTHEHTWPPYHPLSILRDLASKDKHRLPIDVRVPLNRIDAHKGPLPVMMFIFGIVQQLIHQQANAFPAAKSGLELSRIGNTDTWKADDMPRAAFLKPFVFIDGTHDISDVSCEMIAVVEGIVSKFEEMYGTPN